MGSKVEQKLQMLIEFGQVIAAGIRLREGEILELIHRESSRFMDTDNMYIALYDEATDTVRFGLAFVNGKRIDVTTEAGWQPRRTGRGRAEEIIRTKRPLLHNTRAEAEAWYAQQEHKQYVGRTFESWLGVPMMVGERVLGVIATYHPTQEHAYNEEDLVILQAMADQAAIAIDNARLYYELERVIEERTRQLKETQERIVAVEVNAAIGLVTAEIAHHMKNLAGIIRVCAIRLRHQLRNLTSQQKEDLDSILLNSEGISKAAEDLFKPFRQEPKTEVSIGLMLQEALSVLGKQPDIDILVHFAPDLPRVTVQVQKVTGCITELLANALKFTRKRMNEEGIAWGRIEVEGRLAADSFIELTITNHGPAIPRERWERIFALFSAREDETGGRGLGLGLWGARTTMRAHGGDVYVLESNEERTTFLLRLPTKQQNG